MVRVLVSLVVLFSLALAQNGVQIAKGGSPKAHLATSTGQTLYLFTPYNQYPVPWMKDWPEHLAGWIAEWKPLLYTKDIKIDQDLNKMLFGVRMRDDGSLQLTYQGWPLYTHVGDKTLGDQTGYVKGLWVVATPNIAATKVRRDSPLSSKLIFPVQGIWGGP